MERQQEASSDRGHWDKLINLIEKAKSDRGLSESLKTAPPSEVAAILQQEGIYMDELARIFDDLEYIADRGSLRYWSPLA